MKEALRKKGKYHLSNINSDGEGLPIITAFAGTHTEPVQMLLDSGAMGLFMPAELATKLGLDIRPSTVSVTIGDNSVVQSTGIATLDLQIGPAKYREEVIVLADCPYDIIAGTTFFRKYNGELAYGKNRLTLDNPNAGEKVHVYFGNSTTRLVAERNMTLAPRTEAQIPIVPKVSEHKWLNMGEEERWGTVADTRNNPFKVANGIMRVQEKDSDSFNWVRAINAGDCAIEIKKGETIAHFKPLNTVHEILHMAEENEEEKTEEAETATTEEEINAAIEAKPYLKDLDLANGDNNLTDQQQLIIKKLVLKHHTLWDTAPKTVPEHLPRCDIRLREGTFEHQGRVLPMNPKTRAYLRQVIEEKLKRGIIEPSGAPCSSTVLLIPKPNGGGLRFCIDYRALNKAIAPDAYVLPTIHENLASLSGNKYFSSLDMKEAFWNVPLTQNSKELTAFRTPDGLYMYKRMPMGLKTASAVFCRFIDSVLGDLKWNHVLAYIDDLLIATPTFEKHVEVLDKLFGRMNAARLTLGAKKCSIGKREVQFLGHVVGADGIYPNGNKVKAIEALELPKNCKELEAAMGLMGYYRKFIMNYSTIAEPLRRKRAAPHLWKKNRDGEVTWTDEEKRAFFKLRDALTSDSILKHPEWDQPFELHTDASHSGLGAVLSQRVDGKECVIAYASRALAKTEIPYSVWELECLAMIWATRLFRMYLTNTKFKIFTDSRAAKSLVEANDAAAGGRLLRWRLALTEFEFEVYHRKGEKNGNADGLSRLPINSTSPYGEEPTSIEPRPSLNVIWHDTRKDFLNTHTLQLEGENNDEEIKKPSYFGDKDEEAWTIQDWKKLQQQDELCKHIASQLKTKDEYLAKFYHQEKDSIIYTQKRGAQGKRIIVVPMALRAFILNRYHTLPVSAHRGRTKTGRIIKDRYYWPKMDTDIANWVKACTVCTKRKTPRPVASGSPAIVCDAKRRWQCLAIDLVEAGSTSIEKYAYILTVICLFSRYVIAIPIKSKQAKDVAEALFTHVFAVHGRPESIKSDDGREFVNAGLKRLYRHWNIKPITTGGWRPWSNPVERYHRYLNASMTILSTKYGEDWTSYLQAVVFSYNSSACESTGYSPYYLMHGKEPTLLEDIALQHAHDEEDTEEDIAQIVQRMTEAYKHVRKQQKRMAELNRQRIIKQREGKKKVTYAVNDAVMYWEPVQSKKFDEKQAPNKWKDKWTGPHIIVSVKKGKYDNRYTIMHAKRRKQLQNVKPDKLSPYSPWSAALPSTSPELDSQNKPFKVGTWCAEGNLFIVPLQPPWPFGVGKVLRANDDGTILFQWYRTTGHQATAPYSPMWWDGKKGYHAKEAKKSGHEPYTGVEMDEAWNMEITQGLIAIHSFKLTPAGRLPKPVQDECRTNADIWWPKRQSQ
jgi:hypothetical protein